MTLGRWLIRIIEAAAITVTLAAVCQELEKPKEERNWHGRLRPLRLPHADIRKGQRSMVESGQ
jgi:hypothetical protein